MKIFNHQTYTHTRFYVLLSTLLVLIGMKYGFMINIPNVVFIIMIALICLVGDKSEIIAICMCCIPLSQSIDLFYALVICCGALMVKYYDDININSSVIVLVLIALWELLHYLGEDFSIIHLLGTIIPFAVLCLLMWTDLSDLDYYFVVRVFAYTTLSIFLILLIKLFYLSGFNISQTFVGIQRLGIETSVEESIPFGNSINPNSLGVIGVLAVCGLLQIRNARKGTKIDLIIAYAIMVMGALTASRTYLACLLFMLVMFLLCQEGGFVLKLRYFAVILSIIVIAFITLRILFPDSLQNYIGRFRESDITSSRDSLLFLYNDFILSHINILLFGVGRFNIAPKLVDEYHVAWTVPHNSIQELVVAWGIPGILLFAAVMVCMFVSAKRFYRKQRLVNFIPLLIILLKGIVGQMLNSSYTLVAFSLAYLSLVQNFELSDNTQSSI